MTHAVQLLFAFYLGGGVVMMLACVLGQHPDEPPHPTWALLFMLAFWPHQFFYLWSRRDDPSD